MNDSQSRSAAEVSPMDAQMCAKCIAEGGLTSDLCSRCADYSEFDSGGLAIADLEGLSARGKLAFILAEIAAIRDAQGKGDQDDAP